MFAKQSALCQSQITRPSNYTDPWFGCIGKGEQMNSSKSSLALGIELMYRPTGLRDKAVFSLRPTLAVRSENAALDVRTVLQESLDR